jgi:hypothetical protein
MHPLWLEFVKRLRRGKQKMEGQDEKKAFSIRELIEREELKGLLEKTGGGERRR